MVQYLGNTIQWAGTPSDNGHLERFNRALQEECLGRIPRSLKSWQKEIPEYFRYSTKGHIGIYAQISFFSVFVSSPVLKIISVNSSGWNQSLISSSALLTDSEV